MEKIPGPRLGFFSGTFGLSWRWLFAQSIIPALISLIIRSRVQESEVLEEAQARKKQSSTSLRQIFANPTIWKRFICLVLLMMAFN